MKPQEKAKIIADCCNGCTFSCKDRLNCHREEVYVSCMQMHEWTLKQIAERASKWIDNNINYNTDDEVSRTKKEILRKSLLKTIQL